MFIASNVKMFHVKHLMNVTHRKPYSSYEPKLVLVWFDKRAPLHHTGLGVRCLTPYPHVIVTRARHRYTMTRHISHICSHRTHVLLIRYCSLTYIDSLGAGRACFAG